MPITHAFSNTVPNATGTVTIWNGATTSTVAATDLVRPQDWNSSHNVQFNLAGNTTNASSVSGTDVVFRGAGIVTLAGSNTSLVISATAPVMSRWEPAAPGANTSYSSYGQNTLHFQGLRPPSNVTFSGLLMSLSLSSVTSSISHAVSQTLSYGLYARGTGANTSRYELLSTSSFTMAAGYSSNLSGSMSFGDAGTNFTSSSAGTVFGSVLSGQKALTLPFVGSMSGGGDYMFAFANSTNSVGGTGALRASFFVRTYQTNMSFAKMGNTTVDVTNATVTNAGVFAIYSSTSNAWPTNVPLLSLSIFSQVQPGLIFEGSAP